MPELGTCESVLVLSTISLLLTALGLTATAGLRAYVPLLVLALGPFIPNGCGSDLITLSPAFRDLFGVDTPWFVAFLLAVLALGEFVIDKVVGADHANDVVHTVVRPVAGAIVMAGLDSPLSQWNPWAAATVGAALALTVHAAKAVVRGHVTVTTFGIGNVIVSVIEDTFVVVLTILALAAPFLILLVLGMLVLVAVLLIRFLRSLWRRIFGRGTNSGNDSGGPGVGQPPASGPMPAPASRPLDPPPYAPPSQPQRQPVAPGRGYAPPPGPYAPSPRSQPLRPAPRR